MVKPWSWAFFLVLVVAACHRSSSAPDSGGGPGGASDPSNSKAGQPGGPTMHTPDAPGVVGDGDGHPGGDRPVIEDPDPNSDACVARDKEFDAFLQANQACTRDDECAVIGDCSPNADFRAVRKEVADEAYKLMQARCGGAADGPVYDAECSAGTCELTESSEPCCGCPAFEDGDAGL